MIRLYVLYDARCALCRHLKAWLVGEPAWWPITTLAAGSRQLHEQFPSLVETGELTVVASDGRYWRGDHAWLIVLFALKRYRAWARRLAHPAVSIWAANQPAAPLGLAATGPEIALIWRDTRFEVPVAAISPGDATLLEAVQAGFSLLDAAVQATSAEPDHNPQPLLVTLMQAGAFVIPKAIP